MNDQHDRDVRRWMLAALGCALEPRSAVYLSTPITTGLRFVAWRRGPGADLAVETPEYRRRCADEVIAPNRNEIAPLVEFLRDRFDDPVIDPTALEDVPGWEQLDYHRFWTEAIDRYAHTAVFADGWEYSSGCVLELAAAVSAGATLLCQDLTPLAPEDAAELTEGAVADVSRDDVLPQEPLRTALEALQRHRAETGAAAVSGSAHP